MISTQTKTQCEEYDQATDILQKVKGHTSDDTIHGTGHMIQAVNITEGHSVQILRMRILINMLSVSRKIRYQ